MPKIFSHILLTLLFIVPYIYCDAQLITDRPDQTESSSTVPKGDLQIESGAFLSFEDVAGFASRQLLLPTNLFRLGLTRGLELRLTQQLEFLKYPGKTLEGISDMEVGFKVQLLKNENVNTEIALLSHLLIPTGTEELSSGKYGNISKLCISHAITDNIGLGYNIGYQYLGEESGDLLYSLACGFGLNDKVSIYIEPYGSYNNLEEFSLNMDAGLTYLWCDQLQLDFSYGTGITDKMNYVSVGGSWLIERKSE